MCGKCGCQNTWRGAGPDPRSINVQMKSVEVPAEIKRFTAVIVWPSLRYGRMGTTTVFHDSFKEAASLCRFYKKKGYPSDASVLPARAYVVDLRINEQTSI